MSSSHASPPASAAIRLARRAGILDQPEQRVGLVQRLAREINPCEERPCQPTRMDRKCDMRCLRRIPPPAHRARPQRAEPEPPVLVRPAPSEPRKYLGGRRVRLPKLHARIGNRRARPVEHTSLQHDRRPRRPESREVRPARVREQMPVGPDRLLRSRGGHFNLLSASRRARAERCRNDIRVPIPPR